MWFELFADAENVIRISGRDWLGIAGIILAAGVGVTVFYFRQATLVDREIASIRQDIATTESRWVDRIAGIEQRWTDRLAEAVKAIKEGIPPPDVRVRLGNLEAGQKEIRDRLFDHLMEKEGEEHA